MDRFIVENAESLLSRNLKNQPSFEDSDCIIGSNNVVGNDDSDNVDVDSLHTDLLDGLHDGNTAEETPDSNDSEDGESQDMLAVRESAAVECWKTLILVLLSLTALITTSCVYYNTAHNERVLFEQEWLQTVDIVSQTVQTRFSAMYALVESLSIEIQSMKERESFSSSSLYWPMVDISDWSSLTSTIRSPEALVPVANVALIPVVTLSNKEAYENYTQTHTDWIKDDRKDALTAKSAETHAVTDEAAILNTGTTAIQRRLLHSQNTVGSHVSIPSHIFNLETDNVQNDGPFFPFWQTAPVNDRLVNWINYDLASEASPFQQGLQIIQEYAQPVLDQVINMNTASPQLLSLDSTTTTNFIQNQGSRRLDWFLHALLDPKTSYANEPASSILYPIFGNNYNLVAVLSSVFYWRFLLTNVLSTTNVEGLLAVFKLSCKNESLSTADTSKTSLSFTYQLDGEQVSYRGPSDLHDNEWNHYAKSFPIGLPNNDDINNVYCSYTFTLHPSTATYNAFLNHSIYNRWIYTGFTMLAFVVAFVVFNVYNNRVEKRQQVVMERAVQSTAIVSSLFPQQVRDRLFRTDNNGQNENGDNNDLRNGFVSQHQQDANLVDLEASGDLRTNGDIVVVEPAKNRLKSFLDGSSDYRTSNNNDSRRSMDGASHSISINGSSHPAVKPIADLFPHCTVLFADISGFTAWSSLRDPAQVFTLLEAVYHAFDKIARKRGVFKVETVGDSYVAVTGLPDPQEDHAIIMAKFARDCRIKMNDVTRQLEMTLGPDTGDLRMRFGLHSGPVTAGVLRGEKSRFQLFGDTVNTAARMESTGERDKIQCSQSTADLLRAGGRGHWIMARDKLVHAKGKGDMQTYWIDTSIVHRRRSNASTSSLQSNDSNGPPGSGNMPPAGDSMIWGSPTDEIPEDVAQRIKHQRLIDYNTDLLCQHLKRIVARRKVLHIVGKAPDSPPPVFHPPSTERSTVMEECSEVIHMPKFDASAFTAHVDPESIELDKKVVAQLKRYVSIVAAMYRNNPFHNFEHASHVTMSVNKLLQRVVAAENVIALRRESLKKSGAQQQIASVLHDYTYGITSDPLTQFAIVFSALIHDVDHWGVSNAQLIKEGSPMAEIYAHKSVAEQNSVDKAWDLLLDSEEYSDLQKVIFPTDDEYKRFRQVVVNIVVATDIFDKDQSELRKLRWEKAFRVKQEDEEDDPDENDRKATIVIEYIMQASDVAHTMQHWHVYQKWNRRLFDELYTAWRAGRMAVDPTTFWYHGELKFFETYVIPLAKKLKDCGVFGVASDECLNYAMNNMKEWELKGQMIVAELVASYNQREQEERELKERQADESNGVGGGGGAGESGGRRRKPRMARRRSLWTNGG